MVSIKLLLDNLLLLHLLRKDGTAVKSLSKDVEFKGGVDQSRSNN